MASLIITARIPRGIIGLIFERQLRALTAKPLLASILLIVNGVILLGAEQRTTRRRAAVGARRQASWRSAKEPSGTAVGNPSRSTAA